jgi:hypothetical protein
MKVWNTTISFEAAGEEKGAKFMRRPSSTETRGSKPLQVEPSALLATYMLTLLVREAAGAPAAAEASGPDTPGPDPAAGAPEEGLP